MPVESYTLEIRSKGFFFAITLPAIGILLLLSLRMLIGDWCYSRVADVLDDRTTDEMDVVAISESSLPVYGKAEALLQESVHLVPWKSQYPKTLSDLSARMAAWAEAMKTMNAHVPSGGTPLPSGSDEAVRLLLQAIALEPTNADYHLALGQLYRDRNQQEPMNRELQLAGQAGPVKAGLQYAIAVQFLLAHQPEKAVEQAGIVAARDDSYVIYDPLLLKTMREQRNADYVALLSGSYLLQAFEITWRASGRDREAVKRIVPDNEQAREVARIFWEAKAIEQY